MKEKAEELDKLSSREKRDLLARLLKEKAFKTVVEHPLSYGQQALWFLHQSAPSSSAYNAAYSVRILSPVDVDAMKRALQALIQRHATLRTTYSMKNGQPVQVIHGFLELKLEWVDAADCSWEELQRRVMEDYRRPFDLERGPVMRVTLFTRTPDDHVLLLTLHHIACDAWSIWILMHEFRRLYPAEQRGETVTLPSLDKTYVDFVKWQNEIIAGPEGERLWEYWRSQLGGNLPELSLPVDRPYPPVRSHHGSSHPFRLPGSLVERLAASGKSQGATLYMTLLAAFQVLLNRYSGQEEILVGSPTSGRSQTDFAGVVGYFVNPVVLHNRLARNPTFHEFLSQVRHTVLDALTHQDFPLPLMVERLHPQRDPSRTPIFQAMFVLQKPPQSDEFIELLTPGDAHVNWGGLDLHPYELPQMEGQFDLTLEILERAESREFLFGVFKYNTDVWNAETIQQLESHFMILLQGIADNPNRRISELPLLSETESQTILYDWNNTRRELPLDRGLHHWIEDQAARTPDAAALEAPAADGTWQVLSYRELNERANHWAHRLWRLGVGPDVLVGICAERSLEMVVGLLGILKAGGAYVPLDPSYPLERLSFMLEDSQAGILLIQERFKSLFSANEKEGSKSNCTIICLDVNEEEIEKEDRQNPDGGVTPQNLAYVIYTSGSTGKPKGAMNTHEAICNRLLWMQEEYRLESSDRVLQKTPFSFDVSVWEFFWPLLAGARLVMARPGGHQDNAYLVNTIQERNVTTLHFVPSMLRAFLQEPGLEECRSLRRLICSGEALTPDLTDRFAERLPCELHNLYGPTEAAVDVTFWPCKRVCECRTVPIGRPIANVQIHILDQNLGPTPPGVAGELYIGGIGLARGYVNRPDLTAEKFIPDPYGLHPGARLYQTGDLARRWQSGVIEYLGRLDYQVKIRGFRIETGEIESVLSRHPSVREAVVLARNDNGEGAYLAAYVAPRQSPPPAVSELRRFLSESLPEYMIPTAFVMLDALPLTPNGKTDRRALPAPGAGRPLLDTEFEMPRTEVERRIAAAWRKVLQLDQVGIHDNFFDLGGHSLRLSQVLNLLRESLTPTLTIVDLFQYPTIHALARYLKPDAQESAGVVAHEIASRASQVKTAIAVIGMAARFPGAKTIDAFWQNLCDGVESISCFSEEEMQAAGVDPKQMRHPQYVPAAGTLEEIDQFDAGFFDFTPREAEIMDVQHRFFLECAWEALEDAGLDPDRYPGLVGVYAGVGMNTYLLYNLLPHPELVESLGAYQLMIANDKDYLPTRTSYKLNLKGPSVSVQTACSTSLVAVHMACRALESGECDVALAGGASIHLPQKTGYLYQDGMILSPDGHCRAFDARARGTVGGDGVGIVALKRLQDALRDGDTIHAVIRGSAINNDGALKAGYTAPSVEGQAAVIARAMDHAGVEAESIGYVEAHGTGTELGDPIEIHALNQVFRARTEKQGFCAIGSVKTNVGHLDAAAGVAGLIKAVLALKHKKIPPSLHFERPNPRIDFNSSPFFVNTRLLDWLDTGQPRRAGVSSFGIGGTNAHVILEEAPPYAPSGPSRPVQILPLSAQTPTALANAAARLAESLKANPQISLADTAYTLAVGRKAFDIRHALMAASVEEAVRVLQRWDPAKEPAGQVDSSPRPVVFMFSGQGAQHLYMGAGLYQHEPVFREVVDRCVEVLNPRLECDLRTLLYPGKTNKEEVAEHLNQTMFAQPALFVVEYALARLWMSWGIQPRAMIGHSIGEYVAACLAEVFTLEDALTLVAVRGRLMQEQPPGAMLAVPLSETKARDCLWNGLALAAVNGPDLCVISGPQLEIESLQRTLHGQQVESRLLHTSHAFHSNMMQPAVQPFTELVGSLQRSSPTIPYLSNVTGNWITPEEAMDPAYWSRHLVRTVRFADGMHHLFQELENILLEVGPGRTLSSLLAHHPSRRADHLVLSSMRHPHDPQDDLATLYAAVGGLWQAGAAIDWSRFYKHESRRKISLPAYPFEHRRYWIDPLNAANQPLGIASTPSSPSRKAMEDWFYVPSWKRSPSRCRPKSEAGRHWLVLVDPSLSWRVDLASRLHQRGADVTFAYPGRAFSREGENVFRLRPSSREDFEALIRELHDQGRMPDRILHGWLASPLPETGEILDRGMYSLISLAQALGEWGGEQRVFIGVATCRMQQVGGEKTLSPDQAAVRGPVKVIPLEYPTLSCRSVDLDPDEWKAGEKQAWLDRLMAEFQDDSPDRVVAYRGGHRWVETFEPWRWSSEDSAPVIREGGVYFITGGLGGIGLALAEHFAKRYRAKLVLSHRSEFPLREAWNAWLQTRPDSDPISRKIRAMVAMEQAGGEVLPVRADAADEAQMQRAVAEAVARFGSIHGVIHAAGVAAGGVIQRKSREMIAPVMAPKVQALHVLDRLFANSEVDFIALFSSITSVQAEAGQVDYVAANSFMDAFVQERPLYRCINWDTWREVGMAKNAAVSRELQASHEERLRLGITTQEGIEAFERVLAAGFPRIVVSTQDLLSRLSRTVSWESFLLHTSPSASSHPRPDLSVAYEEPANELEKSLAEMWQSLLGIERVGRRDDFFTLGGHSLLATQVVSRLRNEWGVNVPLNEFFQVPTIEQLAERVTIRQLEQIDEDEFEQILKEVEEISPGRVKP